MSTTTPTFLTISTKPNAPISYTLFPEIGSTPNNPSKVRLIVFINGLGLPASSWQPTITQLQSTLKACPAILTYDRYSQGLTTSKDPIDNLPGKDNGHSFLDNVDDLHGVISEIYSKHLENRTPAQPSPGSLGMELLLVGASIGVPLLRLYTHHHADLVSGLVFLDSNICNVNYSDILPDPDGADFDAPGILDTECTIEEYRAGRRALVEMFDLDVRNAENLDRVTGKTLLPAADAPKFVARPWLSVVGHDPVTFVEMGMQRMGTPRCLSRIANRYWAKYNEDLVKLTDEGKCDGVVIAKGCGHFIQMDDPAFVAEAVGKMLSKLGW